MVRARVLYKAAVAAGLTLGATLGMVIASSAPAAAATTHNVTMTGFPTNPSYCVEGDCNVHTVTIAPGDTVVWTYADNTCDLTAVCPGHTVSSTGGPGQFSSATMYGPRLLKPGGPTTFSVTFGNPGTYSYTCAFHGSGASRGALHMDGAVQVLAPPHQSAQSNGPVVTVNPGSNTAASTDEMPTGTSNSVSADLLPNTYIPGLPIAGTHTPMTLPWWLIPAAALLLLGAPPLTLTSLGLAARRR